VRVFFFHGLESGPHGSKYHALVSAGFEVISPDFSGVTSIPERLEIAEKATDGMTDISVVGSSMGGLVAAILASKHPGRVRKLILLAPAVHKAEAAEITSLPHLTVVVRASEDSVIPSESIVDFVEKFKTGYVIMADNHRLSSPDSLATLTTLV